MSSFENPKVQSPSPTTNNVDDGKHDSSLYDLTPRWFYVAMGLALAGLITSLSLMVRSERIIFPMLMLICLAIITGLSLWHSKHRNPRRKFLRSFTSAMLFAGSIIPLPLGGLGTIFLSIHTNVHWSILLLVACATSFLIMVLDIKYKISQREASTTTQ
ncbi:hypothetical protein [Bifidobacterium sp.]|jgi:hypothetical protein|uniref:hypothetical protein n=1 Tax=Bifidobacterium sp. TaxID=41200 RepID=UPI0025BC4601|nr:hypothetical protein [Bifidobacterium sp.]MCI1635515.1 hypothetical protein [Bifidobacterium sp.]